MEPLRESSGWWCCFPWRPAPSGLEGAQPGLQGLEQGESSQVTPQDAGKVLQARIHEKPWPARRVKAQSPKEGSWATPE